MATIRITPKANIYGSPSDNQPGYWSSCLDGKSSTSYTPTYTVGTNFRTFTFVLPALPSGAKLKKVTYYVFGHRVDSGGGIEFAFGTSPTTEYKTGSSNRVDTEVTPFVTLPTPTYGTDNTKSVSQNIESYSDTIMAAAYQTIVMHFKGQIRIYEIYIDLEYEGMGIPLYDGSKQASAIYGGTKQGEMYIGTTKVL